jgi:hypothetical protein
MNERNSSAKMNALSFHEIVWLVPVALALHEFEEWNILVWYQRNFVDMPAERTKTTIRFFLVFLSAAGFVWTGIAVSIGGPAVTMMILLPLVAMMLQNVLQHIYWQYLFRTYAPGIISAILLLLPISVFIIYLAMANALVPVWYMALLMVLIIPGLVQTVKARNRLTPAIQSIHKFSLFGVRKLGISNR